ncbi:MAG: metallophosphoesterase [Ancalomicrobiaceae bacterium]|nr:metallophosphoesterase [Ancalomicrobiaceae bacterium]
MISRRLFLGTFATGFLGLTSYASAIEPLYRLVVKRYDMALPGWPTGAKPLTAALVADIHAVDPWMTLPRIEEIVATTNALRPDIILLLGDYMASVRIKNRSLMPAEWAPVLGKLKAPLGVHAILGNHDYWWNGGPEPVRHGLEAVGIPVYMNEGRKIAADGHDFWLTGTTSVLSSPLYDFPFGPGIHSGQDDLKAALAAVTDDAPILHMAHEPEMIRHMPERVALTLSGHNHGGQISLPWLGAPALWRGHDESARYVYGTYTEAGRHLLVSGGLGCSMLPIRFGVPPEIVLVQIRSAASASA